MILKAKAETTMSFFCHFMWRFHTISVGSAISRKSIRMSKAPIMSQKRVLTIVSHAFEEQGAGLTALKHFPLSSM